MQIKVNRGFPNPNVIPTNSYASTTLWNSSLHITDYQARTSNTFRKSWTKEYNRLRGVNGGRIESSNYHIAQSYRSCFLSACLVLEEACFSSVSLDSTGRQHNQDIQDVPFCDLLDSIMARGMCRHPLGRGIFFSLFHPLPTKIEISVHVNSKQIQKRILQSSRC